MRNIFIKATACFLLSLAVLCGIIFAEENITQRGLFVRNLSFCAAKPRSFGRFEPIGEEGFKVGQDVYLYAEVTNCKSELTGKDYSALLTVDLDMYYEDGKTVYSQKEVKNFNPQSVSQFTKTFVWVKIETRRLRPGEYKVELTVNDEYGGKRGFALNTFKLR